MSATLPDKPKDEADVYAALVQSVADYDRWAKEYLERAKGCVTRYRDERAYEAASSQKVHRFNIFWSNVQTMQPAIYAQKPKPQVERRFKDADPVGRVASETLERCVAFATDGDKFDLVMRSVRDDYLIVGRGVAWMRYVPHFAAIAPETPAGEVADDGASVTTSAAEHAGDDAGDEQPAGERIAFEEIDWDYVAWRDFGHTPARTWDEVRQVWRKVQMTRDEVTDRFGEEIGKAIILDAKPDVGSDQDTAKLREALHSRANVYEIWDKPKRCVYWVAKGYPDRLLDHKEDPLGLREFWPTPRPLYATLTTDSLIPVPDYYLYQDQARELDELSERLTMLTKACRAAGVYDGSQDSSVGRLLTEGNDNTLIPVNQWAAFAERGGLKGVMDFLPLTAVVDAIRQLTERFQAVKAEVYEITGVADIVRGYSSPSETATAQQIKGRFAALRLQDRQHEVARFARDLMAMAGEVIAEHFQPQTIALMAGVMEQPPEDQQAFPQAVALLRQDAIRRFRIDIETDSTIAADEQADKQAATELLAAMGGFLRDSLPAAQQAPDLLPLFQQMLLFGVRRFKGGRNFEAAIEQTFEMLEKKRAEMAEQPPPVDPKVEAAKAQAAVDAQRAQEEMALAREKNTMDQQRAAAEIQAKREAHDLEMQIMRERADMDMAIVRDKALLDSDIRQWDAQNKAEAKAADDADKRDAKAQERAGPMVSLNMGDAAETAMSGIAKAVADMAAAATDAQQQTAKALQQMAHMHAAPRRVVRGPDGRAVGVEIVAPGAQE
jgi:hypothetical protein